MRLEVHHPAQAHRRPVGQPINDVLTKFESHIKDELNIKSIEIIDKFAELKKYEVKPNYKTIGPKLNQLDTDMQTIEETLKGENILDVAAAVNENKPIQLISGQKVFKLQPEDIIVRQLEDKNLKFADVQALFSLALDIQITDELRREGLARDVVRHIQQLRKEVGLQIQDHITVDFKAEDETVGKAIEEHRDYICRETLCSKLAPSEHIPSENTRDVKIGGAVLSLQITKAS